MLRKISLFIILLFALVTPVAATPTGVTWNAEYFGNAYLLGEPLKRQESAVNFDWGLASPANNIPSDGFSARFATDVYFDAGTYRFSALADDRVRVSVAFQAVIDTFNNPQPGALLSADVTLPAGVHHLQIDYSEDTFTAYLTFNWARLDGSGGPQLPVVNVSAPLINPNPWVAAYYASTSLTDPPVYTQPVEGPSRNFGSGAPNGMMPVDNFSVRWESVQPLQAGTYQIRIRADDGVRVYVNGGLVIDQWHSATGEIYSATIPLAKGDHRFTVEYYEAAGFAFVEYNLVLLGGTTIGELYTLPGSGGSASAASNAPVPPPTGYNITAGDALNIRSGPGVSFERVGKMPYQAQAAILGRDSTSTWWQIDYSGTVGWVSARVGRIEPGANISSIPITD